jgi:hypothetical protein
VLSVDNIQGNILGGFNKDFQTLVFLKIRQPLAFKAWLKPRIPTIATLGEVVTFNRLFKSMRRRLGRDPLTLKGTWINIAFSYSALQQLGAIDPADDCLDNAFKDGLVARSKRGILGDPFDDPTAKGNPDNWVIGSPTTIVDVILIVAGDDKNDVNRLVTDLLTGIGPGADPVGFNNSGREDGQNLPNELASHEHFGFLDGVPQPGVRGRLSDDPHDVLTVRQNPNNREQGKPGQELIWPGQFVFGYQGETPNPNNDPEQALQRSRADGERGTSMGKRRFLPGVSASQTGRLGLS